MRKKMLVLFAVLVMLAMMAVPAAAITWGEEDTEHLNVGAMVYDHPDHGLWQTCSGTLIHPRVFLTAGHCTDGWDDPDAEPVWVNFDQNALNGATLLDVSEVITHPDYGWENTNNPHDVGVLILAEPVDIEPAVLPGVGFLDGLKKAGELRDRSKGAEFTVVGYGGTLDWPPPDITYEDKRQVAVSEYVALVPAQLHLSQHAVHDIGGTCFGDSGGPVFWTKPDEPEVLVGITSWGDAQCVATGFNYRVDIPDTLDFIEGVIAELEEGT